MKCVCCRAGGGGFCERLTSHPGGGGGGGEGVHVEILLVTSCFSDGPWVHMQTYIISTLTRYTEYKTSYYILTGFENINIEGVGSHDLGERGWELWKRKWEMSI